MPVKGGSLTHREKVFAASYAASGDRQEAARRAGYASPSAGAAQALGRPSVNEAVRAHQMARLTNQLLPLALDVVQAVLSDENESARNRLTAAKIVIDRTTGPENASEAKEPHEMTAAELQERIDRLRREASDRATKVIEAEPAKPGGKGAFE